MAQVRVHQNYPRRPIRDTANYTDASEWTRRKGYDEYREKFIVPMRRNLARALARFKELGVESLLEIGPGEGTGSDRALDAGLSRVSMVEISPKTVVFLERKYETREADVSITIHEGDVRDVLPRIPDNSHAVGLIFDNTLSNMQEPVGSLDSVREDFRKLVLEHLVRISTHAVLVGVSAAEITHVYLQIGEGEIEWTSTNGKISISKDGFVSQRYDEQDVSALLDPTTLGAREVSIRKDSAIYWCEITP